MLQLPHLNSGLFEKLGLAGSADILNLYAARAARGFGDGFAAIILPAYLLEIGFNPFQIGLVATSALLGSAATTLVVGVLAPRYHLRTLLLACAGLMVLRSLACNISSSSRWLPSSALSIRRPGTSASTSRSSKPRSRTGQARGENVYFRAL